MDSENMKMIAACNHGIELPKRTTVSRRVQKMKDIYEIKIEDHF